MATTARAGALAEHIPDTTDADALLEAFLAACEEQGLALYEHQEEAILELFADGNVILRTPTGSGKSLVALATHFAALARGEVSWYTAPIKALVNEKFFDLCADLGADNVGLITGDATVNADAPIICATAEILANVALREAAGAGIDRVTMDEFHFYSDPDRGWAWQVPLLELTSVRFLLMSATLGDTEFFEEDLTARTGRPTTLVASAERPVPLEFDYAEIPLQESVEDLVESGRAPIYVVHFTQRAATAQAQAFTSLSLVDKERRKELRAHTADTRFDTPFGKELKRILHHGIGVHHAGMLPKYRRLVERLAQAGLLKVICGTDTLGVGVNVPIRTVLMTQLCKFDGEQDRLLTIREFHQIAGRAGRKGFDDEGTVRVQAPAHVIENKRALAKAGDAKKQRKVVKKQPPRYGYVAWNRDIFDKLVGGTPETLTSQFRITHAMLLELLDRPGDGCAAVKRILQDNHDPRPSQREHIKTAIHMYRSLLSEGIVEELDAPDDLGRRVRVSFDLQEDFALNQPLAPFVLDALGALDPEAEDHTLDTVSVVEAVLEDPGVVLRAQLSKIKDAAVADMKAEGVEYEERMAVLDELEWPKPLEELLESRFEAFRTKHPWAFAFDVAPKSVVRDMFSMGSTFNDYVGFYGLRRSEGVLLRYLSDAYRTLVQTIPEDAKTDEVYDLTEWLGAVVRGVDSSLLDEWELLTSGVVARAGAGVEGEGEKKPFDVTENRRAFRVLVRNEMFRWVRLLARQDYQGLAEAIDQAAGEAGTDAGSGWSPAQLAEAAVDYWNEYDAIRDDADARGPDLFILDDSAGAGAAAWPATQIVLDPDDNREWRFRAHVDVPASRAESRAVVVLDTFGCI